MLTPDDTRPIRRFEQINLISASALLAGAALLGRMDLLPGAVIGALAAAINVRASRRIIERFLQSKSKDRSAATALLGIKILCVLACVGAVVYLRPNLAAGMALGFSSIVPASFVLAATYALHKLD